MRQPNIKTLVSNEKKIKKVVEKLELPLDFGVGKDDLVSDIHSNLIILMATESVSIKGLSQLLVATYDNVNWEEILGKELCEDKNAAPPEPPVKEYSGPGKEKLKAEVEVKTDKPPLPDEPMFVEGDPEEGEPMKKDDSVVEKTVEEVKEAPIKRKAAPVFGTAKGMKKRREAARKPQQSVTQTPAGKTWVSILRDNAAKIKTYAQMSKKYPVGTAVHGSNARFVNDLLAVLTGYMVECKKLRAQRVDDEKAINAAAKANAILRKDIEKLKAENKDASKNTNSGDRVYFGLHIRSDKPGLFTVHYGRGEDAGFVASDDDGSVPYYFPMNQLEDGKPVVDFECLMYIARAIAETTSERPVSINFTIHLYEEDTNLEYLDNNQRLRRISSYSIDYNGEAEIGRFDASDDNIEVYGGITRAFLKVVEEEE